jgi:hypothetical protein
MKLWIDDVRPAPEEYVWCRTVDHAKSIIEFWELNQDKDDLNIPFIILNYGREIELLDLGHDAGDFVRLGGDYIKLLDWLEETGRNYPIRIHSQNPVGVANMRRIIERNGWKEIK